MTSNLSDLVLPGDIISDIKSIRGVTVIGPGLRQNEEKPNTLCVSQAGKLCFKEPNMYWIEGKRHRYIPKKGDLVVGVVVKKMGDTLKVDIGSAEYASLSMLAFEGATKKQKPDVQVGNVVYAKLLNAHREMEPELVCIDSYFKAGKLGILPNDGFLINISLNLVQRLLNINNPLLRTMGKKIPYEIVLGVNGKMWLNAKKPKDIISLIGCFEMAETQTDQAISDVCKQIK
ncbi:exosome complex component RRP40 [Anoplophora glabripennis]|uniref:Ribosomal RNA-processing protein 40 n=1 Tax=Anoplophora glabripennis TaxID=217634 RepID=V5H4V1_ANOGL|nr:exosome complex component RRP40 [Anoplophora glabripennis]